MSGRAAKAAKAPPATPETVPPQIAAASRGLAAATGTAEPASPLRVATFELVDVDDIHVPDNDGRLDPALIESLASSMKAGLINPVRLRKGGPLKFEMIAGRRRLAAARLLGWKSIEAVIGSGLTDLDAALEQLNENLQREDLHPLDEAEALRAVMAAPGMTLQHLAARTGKDERYLRDRMRLRKLSPQLSKAFRAGKILIGQAVALSKLPEAEQERARTKGGVFHERYNFEFDLGPDAAQEEIPITVAETEAWITANVKLDVSKPEALELFPATQANLLQAEEKKLDWVEIATLNGWEMDESRRKGGGAPPLTLDKWKRVEKKECASAVLGVVVLGQGRGESFRVCTDGKCKVHWKKAERRAGARPAANRETAAARAQREKVEKEAAKRRQREERWKKAKPKIVEAIAAAITKAPATPEGIGQVLLENIGYIEPAHRKMLAVGKTAESLVRYLAFHQIAGRSLYSFDGGTRYARLAGVDAKKIMDEVAPVKSDEAKPAKKKRGAK